LKNSIEIHQKELDVSGIEIVQMCAAETQVSKFPPHRDDHFGLIIQIKGELELEVDFKNVQIKGCGFCYLLPGQVHSYNNMNGCEGWFIFLDSKFIDSDILAILSTLSLNTPMIALNKESSLIINLTELLAQHVQAEQKQLGEEILFSLIKALIGMVTSEVLHCQKPLGQISSRKQEIATQFRELVREQFRKETKVKAYAAQLYITPLYLTEALKQVTGFSPSYWIQQEIILEAKRLLRFSTLDISQIADQLGFEDPAYFARYFKKHAYVTASAFRKRQP